MGWLYRQMIAEIGLTTSLGSGLMQWLGIVNPVLSFISLIIGISIGLVTLYAKIRNL